MSQVIKPKRPTKNLFEDAMAWTEYVAKLEQYSEELDKTYAEMHKHFDKYRGKIDIDSNGRHYMDWVEEIIEAYIKLSGMVNYIETDAEIAIPIERLFKDGNHITKKEYGLVLIEFLCKELRDKYGV